MREILFRGKRLGTGEWVHGDFRNGYYPYEGGAYICTPSLGPDMPLVWTVDPATVGQYTGLKDKNGKRIFEGDIVYDGFTKDKVVFEDCQWKLKDRHGFWINLFGRDVEVIGNIHDNPELLEVGREE